MTRTPIVSTIATLAIATAMITATPAHAGPEPVLSYSFNTPGIGKLASIHPEPVRPVDIGKLGSIHPEPVRTLRKPGSVNPSPIAVIDPYPTANRDFKGVKGAVDLTGLKGVTDYKGLKGATALKGMTGVVGFKGLKGATALKGMTGVVGFKGLKGRTEISQRLHTSARIDRAMQLNPVAVR